MVRTLLILLCFSCLAQHVFAQQKIEDPRFGFSMDKPAEWFEVDKDITRQNLEKFDFTKEEISAMLKGHQNSIRVGSFMKYQPQTHAGIIPTINILARNNPVPVKDFHSFFRMINSSVESMKQMFDDFTIVTGPDTLRIGTKKLFYTQLQYSMQTGGKKYQVRTRTYAIPGDGYLLQLNMIDAPATEDCHELFDKLQASLVLTK